MTSGKQTQWRKSTKSGGQGGGACVEVRRNAEGMIEVRDTKAGPTGPVQQYRPDEWGAFLAGAKDGEFDDLI